MGIGFGNLIAEFREVDLGVECPSGVGDAAFGKAAEPGIATLFPPIAVEEDHAVIRFLAEGLGNVGVEEYVAIGNEGLLGAAFARLQGLEQGGELAGAGIVVVVDVGEIREIHGFFFVAPDDDNVFDPDGVVGVGDAGEDGRALDLDHGLGLVFGEFAQFAAA